ncbi:MAG: S49 family peptidase [Planctomycetia bacterium]|nr:S49 family peptidase [Planctomycetia bacterium]
MSPTPISNARNFPSGPLCVEPNRGRQLLEAARAAGGYAGTGLERTSLRVDGDGVAVIGIHGLMVKDPISWGGFCATATVRTQIRAAVARDDVRAVLLHVSSPGGFVDGVNDLAADVAAAAKRKPVECFIEDIGASAAYWVASQAAKIWANPTAIVGSLGTFQVLWDESNAYDAAGIKVHVLSTGPLKGAGQPGTEITDEFLAAERVLVADLNRHFMKAVASGRRLTPKQLEVAATGEVWIAAKAKDLGLVDGIRTLDDVVADLAEVPDVASRGRALRARVRFELEAGAIEPPAAPTPLRDRAARAIDDARGATS